MAERLIKRGAEADIFLGEWFGREAIRKVRKPKTYRQPELDAEIRKRRTLHEARFLAEAKGVGVPTPLVYFVDPVRAEIVMQYVKGVRFKELLVKQKSPAIKMCSKVGESVARLHLGKMIHGDLTTSNFIVTKAHRLAFIDFGLSFFSTRLEDRAVDLHLMKEAFTSAHSEVAVEAFAQVLEGYEQVAGKKAMEDLVRKMKEIEARGRYAWRG